MENALDAAATEIVIELEKGGNHSIKVTDNGSGIAPQDVETAFERHATSKIFQFDDLYEISTFGFRGEALPSIAAIADITMITRQKGALSGRKIRIEKGRIVENIEVGCFEGTSIAVTDIFGNVPVRKKFLKKESAEQAHCLEVITRTALPSLRLGVRVLVDGKSVFNLPASGEMSERVFFALGADARKQLITVENRRGHIRFKGFASRPDFTKSTTKGILCYINGRYVRDPLVNHAVMTAYRRIIEPRRYPQVVLLVDLPPSDVDVNVHPSKLEVRFRNPREMYEAVLTVLVSALSGPVRLPEKPEPAIAQEYSQSLLAPYRERIEEALNRFTDHEKAFRETPSLWATDEKGVGEKQNAALFSDLVYLGQADSTYLIFSGAEGIVILDQHAAHERILFERLKAELEGKAVASQHLLIPEILNLSPVQRSVLENSGDIFAKLGIELEPFGGASVKVTAFPRLLSHLDPAFVISDILEGMSETGKLPDMKEWTDKMLAMMACKGAVKAHEWLTKQEVDMLCRDLDAIPFAATCPHGRPLYVQFDRKDLEKLFKRT